MIETLLGASILIAVGLICYFLFEVIELDPEDVAAVMGCFLMFIMMSFFIGSCTMEVWHLNSQPAQQSQPAERP